MRRATFGSTNNDGIANTGDAYSPQWSPDATRVVFVEDHGHDSDISVINKNGTGKTDLTNTPNLREFSPVFSPDGSKIAYIAGNDLLSDIWIMNADGTGATQITETPTDNKSNLDFSPNGQSFVFDVSSDGGATYKIARINVNNTEYIELTAGPRDIIPTWSPDGTMIAFERFIPANPFGPAGGPGDKYHIFVMNAAGTDQTDISPESETSDFAPD